MCWLCTPTHPANVFIPALLIFLLRLGQCGSVRLILSPGGILRLFWEREHIFLVATLIWRGWWAFNEWRRQKLDILAMQGLAHKKKTCSSPLLIFQCSTGHSCRWKHSLHSSEPRSSLCIVYKVNFYTFLDSEFSRGATALWIKRWLYTVWLKT